MNAYLEGSGKPLTILLFVLPLLILYEVGVRWFATGAGGLVEYRVTAFTLLARFFHSCGAAGHYLPAMTVVAVLICTHVASRERWVFNIALLPLMVVESMLLALPLAAVHFAFAPGGPIFLPTGEWKMMACLYLGAGVYEELVFRWAAFSLLSLLLIDTLRVPARWGTPVIILVGAAAFAAYHILGSNPLPWQAFVFIGLRGVYYGIIFVERGFGITVVTHTTYDMIFLFL